MRAAIIYNPKAGTLSTERQVEWATQALKEKGWDVSVYPTHGPGQMTPLAAAFAAEGAEAVFAAGGDGTVGAVAEALAGTNTTLGVLPIGTANVWAFELGLAGRMDTFEAIRACIVAQLNGTVRAVDLGDCNGHRFLLWAGIGLDAHIINKIEPRPEVGKRFGQLYYLVSALWAGLDFRGCQMTIRTEAGEVRGKVMLVIVANVQRYAGTDSVLDPEARVDDGVLEVWSMEGESYLDGLNHLIRFKRGRHLGHPALKKLRGQDIFIELERPMPLQFDGELFGTVTQVHVRMRASAVNVFAPRPTSNIFIERE